MVGRTDLAAPPIAVPLAPPPPLGAAGGGAEEEEEEEEMEDAAAEPNDGPEDPGGLRPEEPPARQGPPSPAVTADANGFREAVNLLGDAADRRPIYELCVSEWTAPSHVFVEDEGGRDEREILARRDEAFAFRRFVALLGQQEGGRFIRRLIFCQSLDWRKLPEDDVERLFRDVLPAHSTIRELSVNVDQLPPRFVRALTENLPTAEASSLKVLYFKSSVAIDPTIQAQVVQAMVDMLNRNVAIEFLGVDIELDSDPCRFFCRQAFLRNTNLSGLYLRVREVFADTLDGVATSSLQKIHVEGRFSDGAVASLTRQLRTHETLDALRLTHNGDDMGDSQALLDFVRTYNYKLYYVGGNLGSNRDDTPLGAQLREYMRRNRRIREQFPHFRVVVSTQLLPRLLGLVSDLPTLVHRTLKRVYANEVSELLVAHVGRRQRSAPSLRG